MTTIGKAVAQRNQKQRLQTTSEAGTKKKPPQVDLEPVGENCEQDRADADHGGISENVGAEDRGMSDPEEDKEYSPEAKHEKPLENKPRQCLDDAYDTLLGNTFDNTPKGNEIYIEPYCATEKEQTTLGPAESKGIKRAKRDLSPVNEGNLICLEQIHEPPDSNPKNKRRCIDSSTQIEDILMTTTTMPTASCQPQANQQGDQTSLSCLTDIRSIIREIVKEETLKLKTTYLQIRCS